MHLLEIFFVMTAFLGEPLLHEPSLLEVEELVRGGDGDLDGSGERGGGGGQLQSAPVGHPSHRKIYKQNRFI